MFIVNVTIETYSEKYCDKVTVKAANENSAKTEAERRILGRHGKNLLFMQVTGVSKI